MNQEHTLDTISFTILFVILFTLSTFAASYRKSLLTANPPPAVQSSVPSTSQPLKTNRKKPPPRRIPKPLPDEDQSVERVIADLSPDLRPKLHEMFKSKGITYPPRRLTLIALKEERRLEVWSPDSLGKEQLVATYPILGSSGLPGPKLRKGDLQVPEGFYRILWFNPDSEFYLSLKLDYPNMFDQRMAELDGRTTLGGDIFIHGYDVSLGCLAIGNPAIEEVFLLVYDTGRTNTHIIITPYDFREKSVPTSKDIALPPWTDMLYEEIRKELFFYTMKPQQDTIG